MRGELLWAFGDDQMGQTFIVMANNTLYESQYTFFSSLHALDITPGHSAPAPRDLEGAFGQVQSPEAAAKCFGCHTTQSTIKGGFDPAHAIPGVTCEGCHGPAQRHVTLMKEGRADQGVQAIFDPANLNPVEQLDFCGACHRDPADVESEKTQSAINVRFQPYRLAKSRCWAKPDPRLTCVACHNPHEQIVREPSFYDSRCKACHQVTNETAPAGVAREKACPVSNSGCTTCHMPKYRVSQMHGSFTDHYIRVLRSGEPFPL